MATLSVITESLTGISVAAVSAAGGGDSFANDGKTRLLIINGSGGALTITVVTAANEANTGLAIADAVIVVPGGETHITAPFPGAQFNDGSGNVAITYSAVTSLTVALIKEA